MKTLGLVLITTILSEVFSVFIHPAALFNTHRSTVFSSSYLAGHNGDCQPADAVAEYEFLNRHTNRIDIAFVPPVHEEKWKYSAQNMELFRRFTPRLVFPMHATAGSQMYTDFSNAWKEKITDLRIAIPVKMGEKVIYKQDISK